MAQSAATALLGELGESLMLLIILIPSLFSASNVRIVNTSTFSPPLGGITEGRFS